MFEKDEKRNRGIVLVGVLAFIVLLVGVLMEFAYRAKVQLDMLHNRQEAVRASHAAHSAAAITKAALSHSVDMGEPGILDLFEKGVELELSGVEVSVRLEPESAKINLNRLVGQRGRRGNLRREYVEALFGLSDLLDVRYDEPVLTYDMILSILEWIAPEGTADMVIGAYPGEPAGSDYYLGLDPPYECKHNFLNSISELLLVKGVNEENLYGRPETGDMPALPGFAEFVTIYGDSRGIMPYLREGAGGDLRLNDLREIEHQGAREIYITMDIRAGRGSGMSRVRVVVRKEGTRVTEVSREYL